MNDRYARKNKCKSFSGICGSFKKHLKNRPCCRLTSSKVPSLDNPPWVHHPGVMVHPWDDHDQPRCQSPISWSSQYYMICWSSKKIGSSPKIPLAPQINIPHLVKLKEAHSMQFTNVDPGFLIFFPRPASFNSRTLFPPYWSYLISPSHVSSVSSSGCGHVLYSNFFKHSQGVYIV